MDILKKLPIIDVSNTETGCCPVFDPEPWQDKLFDLSEYLFARVETKSFLHMPLNMGKIFSSTMKCIDEAKANTKNGYMILSRDVSAWKTEHYFLVDTDVPSLETTTIQGTFRTKVYDGEFRDIPKYMKEMQETLKIEELQMQDLYVFYTTCPKCAKHYGHNYMVFFAKI